MSDDVLLVITGEFGRTPRINNKAGRDHWGGICPLLLAGGGLNMGQVIGQSDRAGRKPLSDPITTAQLTSTILHTLVDHGEVRLLPQIFPEIQQTLVRVEPICQFANSSNSSNSKVGITHLPRGSIVGNSPTVHDAVRNALGRTINAGRYPFDFAIIIRYVLK